MDVRQKSTAPAIWSIAALAMLMLYVLSFGPALYLLNRSCIPSSAAPAIGGFFAPVEWLRTVPGVRRPLNAYMKWWNDKAMTG